MFHGYWIRLAGRALARLAEVNGSPEAADFIRGGALMTSALLDPIGTTVSVVVRNLRDGDDPDNPDCSDVPIEI